MAESYVLERQSHQNEEPFSSIEKGWKVGNLTQCEGFWLSVKLVPGLMACREHFQAREDDVILVTTPKSGTTWLKALAFTVLNRTRHDLDNHPLLTTTPHDLVPFLEMELYADGKIPDLTNLPSPRLFATHTAYQQLPTSIFESNCLIIYLCRNPKDTFVSMWHFANSALPGDAPIPIEEAFELFCRGVSFRGPFWEHVLGYWKASLERPERVLFIKYEELKEDPTFHLRRLAEFLGCPFSEGEEKEGVVENISRFCSFEGLKNLEVNKSGETRLGFKRNSYFRHGVVGDWKNHLPAEMIERMDRLTQEKFGGFGLAFNES